MGPRRINGPRFLEAPGLSIEGLVHAFGTRDLGRNSSRAQAAIKAAFPGLIRVVTVKQVHEAGALVIETAQDVPSGRVHADIILCRAPGIAVCVRTADCVPILIADPIRMAVAAVHSGWRGTVQAAPARAVELMGERFGSRPEDLLAAIGPCIGACHYQVDAPVIEGMERALGAKSALVFTPDGPGKARLDLSRANRLILERIGMPSNRIEETRTCTHCHPDLFFSYRREGKGVPSLHHFIAIR